MNSNERKAHVLGMPYGTACARLRKQILWRFILQCCLDTCFKCEGKIESIEDLSIEHKLPWGPDCVDRFWDVDNIAFSHLRCNRPNSPSGGGAGWRKRIGPDGQAWCCVHKKFLPVQSFSLNRTRWNGLQQMCDECRSVSRKKI